MEVKGIHEKVSEHVYVNSTLFFFINQERVFKVEIPKLIFEVVQLYNRLVNLSFPAYE